jgi:hypothetical protein
MSFDIVTFRGLVEKIIDSTLEDESLQTAHQFFKEIEPVVGNENDAVYGYVIGIIYTRIINLFTVLKRKPSMEEMNELNMAIRKRLFEIKSEINKTFT